MSTVHQLPFPTYYKIRERHRLNSSPREGKRQEWVEYQVVLFRKVVARFDTLAQAIKWVREAETA